MLSVAGRGGTSAFQRLATFSLGGIGGVLVSTDMKDKIMESLANNGFSLLNPMSSPKPRHEHVMPTVVIQQPQIPTAITSSVKSYMIHLVLGAGVCWGSYLVLLGILPDSMGKILPVTTGRFNQAVKSLGEAVISLKDSLVQQIHILRQKQDYLETKQDATHVEVLNVKDHVDDVRDDIGLVQESLALCHASLRESDRRTSYVARGVQLLTRAVCAFVPEDEGLLSELVQFSNAAEKEVDTRMRLQRRRIQKATLESIQDRASSQPKREKEKEEVEEGGRNLCTLDSLEDEASASQGPPGLEQSLVEVEALLQTV